MLESDLCDYKDAYIVVERTITVTGANNRNRKNRSLAFKNNSSIAYNAQDSIVVMPVYNLIDYSKSYRKTTVSLWYYYRDEPNNPPADNYNAASITNSALFKY